VLASQVAEYSREKHMGTVGAVNHEANQCKADRRHMKKTVQRHYSKIMADKDKLMSSSYVATHGGTITVPDNKTHYNTKEKRNSILILKIKGTIEHFNCTEYCTPFIQYTGIPLALCYKPDGCGLDS
jgi:hypothetical protein